MNKAWWESPCGFLCKYWWTVLLAILLLLTAYFTRRYWLPTPASTPAAVSTPGLVDVVVSQREIDLILRDNEQVDGDRIKVTVNGEVALADHTLTGDGTSVPIVLNTGANEVIIEALNEGSVSPNTVEVSITHVVQGPAVQLSSGLNTGQTERFSVRAP